jgi:transmembrane sensor
METNRYVELIAAYLSGNATAGEADQLMQWLSADPSNRAFFEEMKCIWEASLHSPAELSEPDKARAWQQLQQKLWPPEAVALQPSAAALRPLGENKGTPTGWRLWSLRLAAAAAVALLLIVAWQLLSPPGAPEAVMVSTGPGERRQLALPDGSRVWLNANTQLTYSFSQEARQLQLVGEAYFEVATDSLRPFRVLAGRAVAEVLGTSFNLRAYAADAAAELSVQTGRVALSAADSRQRLLLQAGEAGTVAQAGGQAARLTGAADNALAWKEQQLAFQDQPVSEVVRQLERYYGVAIVLSDPQLGNCQFTGRFEQLELGECLAILAATLDLRTEQVGADSLRLSGRGCP